jgi:hypothetical protein
VFLTFQVDDEGASFLLDGSMTAAGLPGVASSGALLADPDFVESNLMHGINGFVYCNNPALTLAQGSAVRVYVLGLGSGVDMHTPALGGSEMTLLGARSQSARLLPGTMFVAGAPPRPARCAPHHCARHRRRFPGFAR